VWPESYNVGSETGAASRRPLLPLLPAALTQSSPYLLSNDGGLLSCPCSEAFAFCVLENSFVFDSDIEVVSPPSLIAVVPRKQNRVTYAVWKLCAGSCNHCSLSY
jgi:hypothetical protein